MSLHFYHPPRTPRRLNALVERLTPSPKLIEYIVVFTINAVFINIPLAAILIYGLIMLSIS